MSLHSGSAATTTTLTTAEGAQTVRLDGLSDCEMFTIENLSKSTVAINFDEVAAAIGPGNVRLGKKSTLTRRGRGLPADDTLSLWAPADGLSVAFAVWR
jgi:hypothetical protein